MFVNKKFINWPVIIILFLTMVAGTTGCGRVSTSREYRGTLEVTEVDVRAELPGQVLAVAVEEGSVVHQGDLLAKIDAAEISARKLQAEAELARARANLEKAVAGARVEELASARAGVDKAKAALDLARDAYNKAQKLYAAGAIPEQKYKEAQASLEAARADFDRASQQLALYQSGTRQEDIAAARALVTEAEAAVREAQAYLSKATITAPLNGEITMRAVDPGDTVASGYTLFTISDPGDMWLEVFVPEDELAGISPGTRAEINFTASAGKRFSGRVVQVSKEPAFAARRSTDEQGEKDIVSFKVKIKVERGGKKLLPGMTGYVTFKAGDQ